MEKKLFNLFGGVVDLVFFNKIYLKVSEWFVLGNYVVKNILFGVCEFVMGVVVNGMMFYGGV